MKKEKIEVLEEFEVVEEKKEKKAPLYIGYTPRLIVSVIFIPILSVLAIILLYNAFRVKEIVNIRYSEKGTSQYKLLGKENNVLSAGEDGKWNQNEIDSIYLATDYQLETNVDSNIEFEYQMIAILSILEKNNPDKVFFQKTVELTDQKKEWMENNNSFSIHEEAVLDYEEYKTMVSQYAESYGVETDSYLDYYLVVDYKTTNQNDYYLVGNAKPGISLSVSKERTEIEEREVNSDKRINKRPTVQLESPGLLGLGILSGIGAVVALAYTILLICSTMDQRSLYDKTIETFLKKHKGQIEPIKKAIPKKKRKVIRINTFKELLQAKKESKQKIFYHVINEHTKCEFYVVDEEKMTILTIKEIDLENEKKD